MGFLDFAAQLKRRGATMTDIYRLDRQGRESAKDAHLDMYESGEMENTGIYSRNDFHSFCVHIGREFVLYNLENDSGLFEIHG